jgi:phage tail-like protein
MIRPDEERLYNLLPAVYRQRDHVQGEPLRALMAVLETELQQLEADLDATYDNWFIETCDAWVIPYIADLVGVRGLEREQPRWFDHRRLVANAIAYQRRKGTVATLEGVIRDVTGRAAMVVEFSRLLAITPHIRHIRPHDLRRAIDVRQTSALQNLNGPFDTVAHTVNVRNTGQHHDLDVPQAIGQGAYNLDHVGIFLWRLQYYPVPFSGAYPVDRLGGGRFTFHPLGHNMPLYQRPQPSGHIAERTYQKNLPIPITRELFAADLAEYHQHFELVPHDERPPNTRYYGPDRSLNILWPDADNCGEAGKQVDPLDLVSMDLSGWDDMTPDQWQAQLAMLLPVNMLAHGRGAVAVDVELGRIAFFRGENTLGEQLIRKDGNFVGVSFTYGFSGDIGGGPYDRRWSMPSVVDLRPHVFEISVAKTGTDTATTGNSDGTDSGEHPLIVRTMQNALKHWEAYRKRHSKPIGLIRFLDNGRYGGNIPPINLPDGSRLILMAEDGVCPSIIAFGGNAPLRVHAEHPGAEIVFNGLHIGCPLRIEGSPDVNIQHCTIMASGEQSRDSVIVAQGSDSPNLNSRDLSLAIERSIVGSLYLPGRIRALSVKNSILDGRSEMALTVRETLDDGPRLPMALTLEYVTVFGQIQVDDNVIMSATGVIFGASVVMTTSGPVAIQFSYVPPDSSVTSHGAELRLDQTNVRDERPVFNSIRLGEAAYAQLSLRCPRSIRRGAADGSEMGAFHYLYQPQREDNLLAILDDYLPAGMEASVYYVT